MLFSQFLLMSWTGFIFNRHWASNILLLGPFQGKVAGQSIAIGSGVCEKTVEIGKPIIVDDVLSWEGQIACDSESRSEIVVPIRDKEKRIRGVLDIDCPIYQRIFRSRSRRA